MLHPLEHVCDQQNPLADTPTLASCHAPQLRRPRLAAKEIYWHRPSPKTWYACLITLPYLEITGSRYNMPRVNQLELSASRCCTGLRMGNSPRDRSSSTKSARGWVGRSRSHSQDNNPIHIR